MSYRNLSKNERSLLGKLVDANKEFIGNIDFNAIEAEEVDELGSLKFRRKSNAENIQKKLPIEAMFLDVDDMWLHALLFSCEGELDEPEFYKDDSSPIRVLPNPDQWIIDSTP